MAHARYIMRQEATQRVYSERMPKQWHAVQRFLEDHENGLRKNGRVLDKFIVSIPHDISEAHASETLRRFGNRLGMGRAPFLFSLQGFDTRNHHAHFIFIDRDPDTGKRVYGTTERNSTHGIKLEWQHVANEAFEELGYDVRVKVHEGYEVEAVKDNHEEAPETPSVGASDVDDLTDIETSPEDTQEGDETMAVIEQARDEQVSLAGHDIRLLHSTLSERNKLHDAQQRLMEARQRLTILVQQREDAALKASLYTQQTMPVLQMAEVAEERLRQHQKANGKLRGIGFSLFGYEVKTNARRSAEAAYVSNERSQAAVKHVEQTKREHEHYVATLSNEASAAEREAFMRQNELRATYGEDLELKQAGEAFDATILKVVQSVSPEEALEAFETLELTEDEYEAYLEQSGNAEALEAFRENRDLYIVEDVQDYDPS
ncbi:hypothetical protein RRU01S_04_01700 [Agrobacterium rubi TR3 = NBRC 13261]|uniref:MobA/VirD2-like nuclease domain-containing protein n=2 Tax=Agrobacterium rubi TaxID=28099 RepID=A0A081CRQ2_9HYPH|nr:hypothetical protein [Agrobacterium rubi]GAK69348.1 hypothetical protein RRU01S_04_01700 [Agrobacterium rubi TR3 = NBRC 13261]